MDGDHDVGTERVDQSHAELEIRRDRRVRVPEEVSLRGSRQVRIRPRLVEQSPQVQPNAQVDHRFLETAMALRAGKMTAVSRIDDDPAPLENRRL
ncbi:MAG: hypothetical protein P8181_04555 [bacterium]